MGSLFDPPKVPPYTPPPAPTPPPPPPPAPVPKPKPKPAPEPTPDPETETAADEAERQAREAEKRAARGWYSTVNTSFRGVLDPLPTGGAYGTKSLLGD